MTWDLKTSRTAEEAIEMVHLTRSAMATDTKDVPR